MWWTWRAELERRKRRPRGGKPPCCKSQRKLAAELDAGPCKVGSGEYRDGLPRVETGTGGVF